MLPILVYDPDPISCALCSQFVVNYVNRMKDVQLLASTSSAEEAMRMVEASSGVIMVLLAVGSEPDRAFELGKYILKINRDSYAVYMVQCLEQVVKLSENCIRPAGLVVQPVTEPSIVNLIERISTDYQELCGDNNDDYIVITNGSGTFRLSIAQILYIEATEKKVTVWTERRCYAFRVSLKYIEDLLPAGRFLRCHRSYIVNRDKIAAVDYANMSIELVTGDMVYMSRAYKNDVKALLDGREAANET